MGCGQKKLSVSVAVPPAPVQVPSQRPLAPSVASVTSVANDKRANFFELKKIQHFHTGVQLVFQKPYFIVVFT